MEIWTVPLVDRIVSSLQSIDMSLKALVAQNQKALPVRIATDKEMTGKYGDPVVRSMPKFWTGADYKGKKYSECPPELLDQVADQQEWVANKADEKSEHTDDGKPIAPFRRNDAAKARGWAQRMRKGGWTPPAPAAQEPASWASGKAEPLTEWEGPNF